MVIALVAYPNMSDEHHQWINKIRAEYPQLQYENILPHFTLVFPIIDILDREIVTKHIQTQLKKIQVFQFAVRCAIPHPERKNKRSYLFLVPDEGFSNFIRSHDALYTGILSKHLNIEIPYLPHITIGYCDDAQLIRKISIDINQQNIEILGKIDRLALMENIDGKWNRVQEFALSS